MVDISLVTGIPRKGIVSSPRKGIFSAPRVSFGLRKLTHADILLCKVRERNLGTLGSNLAHSSQISVAVSTSWHFLTLLAVKHDSFTYCRVESCLLDDDKR